MATTETEEQLKKHQHVKGDGSWWLTDCKNIPLTRVCGDCWKAKKTLYNPWVFSGYDQSDIDEQIEED